ncbi:solute carrier family 41 member 1 [Coprinopsis sp. MPI-PUGE-AT-0042]|nr:solute carrier family 41 member 1 [Coprinopsis sp. MPI-PUGE-AT-0042]
MNGHSPGHIELIGIDDVVKRAPPLSPPKAPRKRRADDQGLLASSRESNGYSYPPPLPSRLQRTREIWEQIKWIVLESAPTLLLTTVSLLFSGKLLDQVAVDQLIMIIPAVLNLQGNLEMNLSARLSTAANIGELDDPVVRRALIIGNWTASPSASHFRVILCFVCFLTNELIAYAVQKTYASSTIRSRTSKPRPWVLMCALILFCRRYRLDPDNIAPAVASCLGDLVTLCMIGLVSTLLIPFLHTPLPFIVGLATVAIAIACLVYTLRNEQVKGLILQGWSPLLGAMMISSATGMILDVFVSKYEGFAVLAVVISGLPGAAGSIFVSRLSTALHAAAYAISHPGTTSPSQKEPGWRLVMMTLMTITLPVEVVFLAVLHAFGWLEIDILFVLFSILFFCFAVFVSLIVARYLTNWLWSKNRDPDIYALPVHSALMDLVGQGLLVLCFEIVSKLGAKVKMRT